MDQHAHDQPHTTGARRRAVVAFVAVAIGLFAARAWGAPAWAWWLAVSVAIAAAAALRGRACSVALALALGCLSGAWLTTRVLERPADDVAVLVASGGPAIIRVEGLVLTPPARHQPPADTLPLPQRAEPAWGCRVSISAIDSGSGWTPARGTLRVRVAGGEPRLLAGQSIRLTGAYAPIEPAMNPGEPDWDLLARQEGVSGRLTLSSPDLIEPRESSGPRCALGALLSARASLQARAHTIITRAAGDDPSNQALLLGLLLGEYDPAEQELRGAWARQGLAHVLSISGFHLAIMAWVLLTLVRLTGDWGRWESLLVGVLIAAYWLLVPASSPLSRSAVMVLVLLAGEAIGRRYDRLTILAWVAIALLAWRPLDLWSLGYQLSVGMTATLLWLGQHFNAALWGVRLRGTVRHRSILRTLRDHAQLGISAATLCWLVSLPLILSRVGIVSPLGILATLVVTPLVTLTLWVGYATLLVGVVISPAASLASGVLSTLVHTSDACVRWLDALPGSSLQTPPTPLWWTAAATLLALLWVRLGRRLRGWGWPAMFLLAGALAWVWTVGQRLPAEVHLRIDTFSVGDGSCHLLRSGRDALLWDVGAFPTSGSPRPSIVQAARALGVHRARTLVITHPDLDHFGGIQPAVEGLGVQEVLVPERFITQAADHPEGAAAISLRWLRDRGTQVRVLRAGDTFACGLSQVRILAPAAGCDWPEDNDHSLVALIHTPSGRSVLLTGDIGPRAIEALRLAAPDLHPDVLELPHHGSVQEASAAWVAGLNPRVVLQSAGPRRARESAPAWRPLREHRAWLCTGERGASWVELSATGFVRAGARLPARPGL